MTTIDTTEIVYDRITKDYAILDAGQVVGFAANYRDAEQQRTQYLAQRRELDASADDNDPPPPPEPGNNPDIDSTPATEGPSPL